MILFLGSESLFSVAALRTLIEAKLPISGAVLPPGDAAYATRDTGFPVYRPNHIEDVCRGAGVVVSRVSSPGEMGAEMCGAQPRPELILCACFPFKLPVSVLDWPLAGCFNVHPSLLPAYRGPAPVFWQLRAGEAQLGVTLHRMTGQLDAGEILAQRAVAVPCGAAGPAIDTRLARAGARLVAEIRAKGVPVSGALPQAGRESYHSWPCAADFDLDTRWPAVRAFTFMRGTRHYAHPYRVVAGGETLSLDTAIGHDPHARLSRPFEHAGSDARIRFTPGVLLASLHRAHCE